MPSSQNIKGGGRAVWSSECQQSVISLLMTLERAEKEYTSTLTDLPVSTSSKHIQQLEERRFVKRLVRRYERYRLAKQFNGSIVTPIDLEGDGNRASRPNDASSGSVSAVDLSSASRQESQGAAHGSVRLEIADAVFKSGGSAEEKKMKTMKKSSKSSSSKHSLPFQSSTKKVIVLPRVTTITELCEQARAKLRIKSKTPLARAFVVEETASSKFTLFDLQTDLSGLADGTTVYVTTTETQAASKEKKDVADNVAETIDDLGGGNMLEDPEEDPLDRVKQAYATMSTTAPRSANNHSSAVIKHIVDPAKVAKWVSTRNSLPAAASKSEILSAIRSSPVVVLSGATGSGKSTQVPQFIYEQQQEDGVAQARPYIIVTQPRRVAAISLSQRVAEEMGSPPPGSIGSSVGYIVRLDRRVADNTCRIIYCTVGVLLRMLVCPKTERGENVTLSGLPPLSLETISHLILDEVHERDVNTDFSLTLLRGLLKSQQYPQLRLILMSATASSEFFVDYFASVTRNSPLTLEIPGRTFPVQVNWLPTCEKIAGVSLWGGGTRNETSTSQQVAASSKTVAHTKASMSPRAQQKIDNKLIRALIVKIIEKQQLDGELVQANIPTNGTQTFRETGAVLVFLPGKAEIESLARCLYEEDSLTGDREVCQILKLYSSMPRNEQHKVFLPALSGTIKIVLATNVAETSVTIPDISHVIDTGRVKESRFNASTRIKELVTVWTSQASAKQRSGRAGRTSVGTCWRLYSEQFFNREMTDETAPEMVRTPLDELILQICLLFEQRRDEHKAKTSNNSDANSKAFPLGLRPIQFLSKTPSPPSTESLVESCKHLLEVDALRVVDGNPDNESGMYRLTPLGYHLSRLPMDAKVGKVLIVGCILGCLDGALTIAASLSCTRSFFFPLTKSHPETSRIVKERESLVENGFGGRTWLGGNVKGDLIAVIAVYRAWKNHRSEGQRWKFCKFCGLDMMALQELDQLRTQFSDLLGDSGFVPKDASGKQATSESWDDCNHFSEDAILTSCCLIAGLYPNICTLMRPRKGGPRGGRLLTKDGHVCRPHFSSFQRKRVQDAAEVGRDAYGVFHAKQTIVGTASSPAAGINGSMQRPPEIFLTEVSFISRFALLLFGGELEIVKNAIIVDGWLKFKVSSSGDDESSKATENAVLILSLREALDKVVVDHILETTASVERKRAMMERHKAIIQVVRQLLADE